MLTDEQINKLWHLKVGTPATIAVRIFAHALEAALTSAPSASPAQPHPNLLAEAVEYLTDRTGGAVMPPIQRTATDVVLRALAAASPAQAGVLAGMRAFPDFVPEDGTECLVSTAGKFPGWAVDTWREQYEAPVSFSSATIPVGLGWDSHTDDEVTHWMPLPAAPCVDSGSGNTRVEELEKVCAEAYQVVGSLLSDLGKFDTPQAEKILDNLSEARMVHDDVLPWPSFPTSPASSVPPDGGEADLTVKSGPFKGKPQQWFTRLEVIELLRAASASPATTKTDEGKLGWCPHCGEGVTNFCRGKLTICPQGLTVLHRPAAPASPAAQTEQKEKPSSCGLTECRGQPQCRKCALLDAAGEQKEKGQ